MSVTRPHVRTPAHAVEAAAAGSTATHEMRPAPAAATVVAEPLPPNLGMFFSIYFGMTGVHALHILGGMIATQLVAASHAARRFRPGVFRARRLRRPLLAPG